MRYPWMAVLAILVVSPVGLAADPDGGDLSKLQGRWQASVGRKSEIAVSLEIKGSEVSATISPKLGPKVRASGEVEIDETVTPRSLDWVKFSTIDGQEVPKLLSIYRIEGDRLYLRSGGFNDARPKGFEKGGEGIWTDVLVFTRASEPKVVNSAR